MENNELDTIKNLPEYKRYEKFFEENWRDESKKTEIFYLFCNFLETQEVKDFVAKSMGNYIEKNFVDVKDIALGDTEDFMINKTPLDI